MDSVNRVAARQDGVITKAQAVAAGLAGHEVDYICRSGQWARLARGVYLVDPGQPPRRRAVIRAAVLSLGPAAVAVLDTAAELHGIAGLPQSDEVHVSLPRNAARSALQRDPYIRAHHLAIPARRVTRVAGIPATDPVQTAADLLLRVDRLAAVSILDSALNRGLIAAADLATIPALAPPARRHGGTAPSG